MFGIIAKLELDKSNILDQIVDVRQEVQNNDITIGNLKVENEKLSKRETELLQVVLEYETAISVLRENEDNLKVILDEAAAIKTEMVNSQRQEFIDQWPTAEEPEPLNEQNSQTQGLVS